MRRLEVAGGLVCVALFGASCSREVKPAVVTITAETNGRPPAPYDLLAPASAAAGPTLFRFENRGTRTHELQLFRFRQGISEDSGRTLLARRSFGDSLVEPGTAVLIAPAHTAAPQQVLVYLKAGEVYGLMCQLRDSAGAPTHDRLGEFTVLPVHAR